MAHTQAVDTRALRWLGPPAGPAVVLLDQTRLPAEEAYLTCRDVRTLEDAIRRLVVRGAPLLGLAGAYGVALAAYRGDDVAAAADVLSRSRPTAVNLSWGARRALAAYRAALDAGSDGAQARQRAAAAALAQARAIEAEDAAASAAIAKHGLGLVGDRCRILTHCNTGALVSAGEGTAFAIILAAHRDGRVAKLWVDETRPLLQGARLTAYEAGRAGIPHAVLADSAAASLMAAGEVDLVITGADRIAADGSVANKVGTYGLAVLAHHHGVPFVVAAPLFHRDHGGTAARRRGDFLRRDPGRAAGQRGAQPRLRRHRRRAGDCPGHRAWGRAARQCRYAADAGHRAQITRGCPNRYFRGTMRTMKGRVLVVDDDAALSEMIGIMLRGEGFDPMFVADGDHAVQAFRDTRPDLVLLDLMLPGLDGIDVCRQIRTESGVPIVMLTAKSDTVDVVLGLESGADDYIVKPFKSKELIARVRARLRRTEDPVPEILQIGDVTIDVAGHSVKRDGQPINLTPLEFDLLVALARKPRQVFTREVLLEQVWGYRHAADTRLVNVHVQRLRAKIERDPEHPEIVVTVRGVGYKAGPS